MSSSAVVGLQWGDEGKGKVIDSLASEADYVVRYAGGNNAGHTVIVGDQKYVLHLIPGGILHDGTINLIGRGLVVDLTALLEEMDGLVERGVPVDERLRIDGRAHVIFPYHCQLDGVSEAKLGAGKIGTTGRGIGPAYADKVGRTGIRVADLLQPEFLKARLEANVAEKATLLDKVYGQELKGCDDLVERTLELAERLAPLIVDGGAMVRQAYREGKRVLFEGAQGTMLDLDSGTFPFVTSSWTGVAGIAGGTGMSPRSLDRALAVTKAYTTRVGEGPFPSELHGEVGERLRAAGNEYGATTGRPRRCGWFDVVLGRFSCEVNGLDGIFLTNLDVLSGFGDLEVVTGYRHNGEVITDFPGELSVLDELEVVTEVLPGWEEDITGVRNFDDLPTNCQRYVDFLEQKMGVPFERISVGPGRDQIFVGKNGSESLW
jgi:adenylosuccinate synthase